MSVAYDLYNRLFGVLSAVKLYHYQTPSYGQHKACDWFYDNFLELADKLLESYQGHSGRIPKQDNVVISFVSWTPDTYNNELINLHTELESWKSIFQPEFENIILDMMALIDQFIYLLSFK